MTAAVATTSAQDGAYVSQVNVQSPNSSNPSIDQSSKTIAAEPPTQPFVWTLKNVLQTILFFINDRDPLVWLMTSAFTLLFFAYPIQGVQTIRYPSAGSYILLVLYGVYGITSLFATPLVDLIGPEFCMPFGALTYGLWIASGFSGDTTLMVLGAASFGFGAGIMWVAAGSILAIVSTPHNRGSNAGIFQFGFHLGVFAGGLTLSGVIDSFSDWNNQYAVFLGLCGASLLVFLIFIPVFRYRFRNPQAKAKRAAEAKAKASVESQTRVENDLSEGGAEQYRVVHDDGTVEFRSTLDQSVIQNADVVVADLALNGGRTAEEAKLTWRKLPARLWQSCTFLFNPVFGPCVLITAAVGGVNQGWFNSSFNQIANHAGDQWPGNVYAISEAFGMLAAVGFGMYFDKLRKNYKPAQYKYVMYYSIVAHYCMCACALGAAELMKQPLGNGEGELKPEYYYAILIVTCFFYNTSLLALEITIYTYLTTFIVYNADIAFATKVFCEAAGYMVSYGLVNVLGEQHMIIVMLCVHIPGSIVYVIWFRAPETPAAQLLTKILETPDVQKLTTAPKIELADVDGLKHTSSASTFDDTIQENSTARPVAAQSL